MYNVGAFQSFHPFDSIIILDMATAQGLEISSELLFPDFEVEKKNEMGFSRQVV